MVLVMVCDIRDSWDFGSLPDDGQSRKPSNTDELFIVNPEMCAHP
jgi:hypothetical protein